MAVVLMANELGAGLGHITRLVPVARALAARGHQPVFVLRDLVAAAPAFEQEDFPLLPAPHWPGRRYPKRQTRTFACILADKGWAEPRVLLPQLRGWEQILDRLSPDLIVGDYCPALTLAAYGVKPLVLLGDSFTLPPAHLPEFPVMRAEVPPVLEEQRVLANVREVQRLRGLPMPETLPGVFAAANRFLLNFAELDIYRDHRREAMAGPLTAAMQPVPAAGKPRFYAYLSAAYPGIEPILKALAASGLEGSLYIHESTAEQNAGVRKLGLEVFDEPQPLDQVLPPATVVIHHGGVGVTTASAAMGRPQLLLTRYMEQRLTAYILKADGAAVWFRGKPQAADVIKAAEDMARNPGYAQRAMALAQRIQASNYAGSLDAIVERCLSLLPKP
jgi:UDP:flavonoid glycosyltransferase YjiC (YdhE family)